MPTPSTERLRIADFVDLGETPGNVAICLSGGGSRALTAGMGQLRALRHLRLTDGGPDLLSLSRALSTVSGGSWLGTTWTFLPSSTSDDDYLNRYADPGSLVPKDGPTRAVTLDTLPPGNLGHSIDTIHFSPELLALQMLWLRIDDVPTSMLWQTLVGLHILEPYGLFQPGHRHAPTSVFSYDQKTLQRDVIGPNPVLTGKPAHLVTPHDAAHSRRPYLLCNCSIFVRQAEPFQSLAPVQCTPFWSGLVGNPHGTDANGRLIGGGGMTSFAFNSNFISESDFPGNSGPEVDVTVGQVRQWSLTDIVGTSSAFFAQVLQDFHLRWKKDPTKLLDAVSRHRDHLRVFARSHLSNETRQKVESMTRAEALRTSQDVDISQLVRDGVGVFWLLQYLVDDLQDILPHYPYWPVRDPKVVRNAQPTRFADGGDLENTGLVDALSYDDVDRVLAGVHSEDPLVTGDRGVMVPDGNGGFQEVPGTRLVVTNEIPPLFGYQPYVAGKGYRPYPGDDLSSLSDTTAIFRVLRIFDRDAFPEFLQQLWRAMGNQDSPDDLGPGKPGKKQRVPRVVQTLNVVDNDWCHVQGTRADGSSRTVEVLWLYLDRVRDWYEQLQPEVRKILGDFDDPKSFHRFPNYLTVKTDLDAKEINLMSNLTAWCLVGDGNAEITRSMFEETSS